MNVSISTYAVLKCMIIHLDVIIFLKGLNYIPVNRIPFSIYAHPRKKQYTCNKIPIKVSTFLFFVHPFILSFSILFSREIFIVIVPCLFFFRLIMAMNSGFSDHEILKVWIYRGNYTQKNRMFSFIPCYTKNGQTCLDKHI